jgi:hypothetical protein
MSAQALLRAVIAFSPSNREEEDPATPPNARYIPLVAHRNKLHGKMRNTLQVRAVSRSNSGSHDGGATVLSGGLGGHGSSSFLPGGLSAATDRIAITCSTSPRSASVPLSVKTAAPSAGGHRTDTAVSGTNSSSVSAHGPTVRPVVHCSPGGAAAAAVPPAESHSSAHVLFAPNTTAGGVVGRHLSPPPAPPRLPRHAVDDGDGTDIADAALRRKQFARKSLLRTRRMRHPTVADTPRGVQASLSHPTLPFRRRQLDVLGAEPFHPPPIETSAPRGISLLELPTLSVTGGVRRLMPRLTKIPHLYREFPR